MLFSSVPPWFKVRRFGQRFLRQYGLKCLQEGARFMERFFVLARRIGIGHNARPDGETEPVLVEKKRSDEDIERRVSVKPDPPKGPGVGTALVRLKPMDKFHRADFGTPGDGPPRKARLEKILPGAPGRQGPPDGR